MKIAAARARRSDSRCFQFARRSGDVSKTSKTNVHWRLLSPKTVCRSSKGIWITTARKTNFARSCRTSRMGTVERCGAYRSHTDTGNGGLCGFHEYSWIWPLLHPPHFVDVDFLNEPTNGKPVVQAWVLALKEKFVLISRGPIFVGDDASFDTLVELGAFN